VNLFELLARSARTWPELPAIARGDRVHCTYRELTRRAVALSAGLRGRLGLGPGARVALAAQNCAEYLEILFACWHAGIVAVPVNSRLHARELDFVLEHSEAAALFATPGIAAGSSSRAPTVEIGSADYAKLLGDAGRGGAAEVAPESPAWIFYTSGTTGRPKGAVLSHRNLLFMTLAYFADIDRLAPGGAIVHAAPLSHGSGLYALPHVAAGSAHVISESASFDPEEVFDAIERRERVSLFAAPTMVTRMLASPTAERREPRNLQTLIYGGAPMYRSDLLRALELFGPRLYNLYGQGESPMTISGLPQWAHAERDHPRHAERLASCGPPRTGVELGVVGDDGEALAEGEIGEVVTRSDCVMAGYWRDPDATASAIREGWLHTGDRGFLDADGFLTLSGRSKEMILSGGSNIYPREVEEVLLGDARVDECAVVGRAHPEWGEEVVAFVVPRAGAQLEPAELDALCLTRIARYKRPREYRIVDALPKTESGKVKKTELREQLAQGPGQGRRPAPAR
jgi:long-chain acyl-CoA synthetase